MIKNLKKVISTFAAVALLATSASAFAVTFPDVDESASYAGAVEALTTLGIVNGDDNGKFNPDNTVTRAEFAKMVVEALGAGNEASSSTSTDFVDAKGHWAVGYIQVGVSKGFINGYDETTFGPDDQVTYAQAVKMLVAAIGYDTYASQQGGWPSGYLAYGSELDIINGVTGVTNDTALTRAQCAVLVYNTLKAPICKINGYEQNYQGNWVPKLEEMNGKGEDWQTLLTTKHNAYVVKGRVMDTDKKENTVDYLVEAAENFDDLYVTGGVYTSGVAAVNMSTTEMNVGTTNAADMLFTYTEAIVQKDKDTSEYTIVSIVEYGAAKTVEFAAKDIDEVANATIDVKKDGSSKTTTYKLNSDAKLYVNGELVTDAEASALFADTKDTAVGKAAVDSSNKRGTVTLVDKTDVGSTSTDGKYDFVMVTYYDVAQVSDVRVKNDEVTIITDKAAAKINWSLVDEDTNSVVFTKDGAEISYEDINEDDIILVARDVVGTNGNFAAFSDSEWYEVYVSDKTVSGTATGKSTTEGKEYLLVDGTKYEFDDESEIASMDLNTSYILSLDSMGYVYTWEQGESSKNIGIVVGMYTKSGEDTPTVRLINTSGSIVTYETKTVEAAKAIADAVGQSGKDSSGNPSFTKNDVKDSIEDSVIEYTISSGKIVLKGSLAAVNADDEVEYKASTSKLGGYTIDETATKIVDLDDYLNNDGDVAAYDMKNLEDEGDYKAWVYDRNTKTGVHNFVILTSGTTSLKPTSALAVVTASGSVTDVDGVSCQVLTVARNGEEDIEVLTDYTTTIPEGTVIMYTVGSDGYVETANLHKIYTPKSTYASLISSILGVTNFTSAAANSYITDADKDGVYSLTVSGNTDDDVEVYYGPVYTASASVLELFKTQTAVSNGTSSINDTESFTLAGANVYTYNYDLSEGDGVRVSVGATIQKSTLYKNMFGADGTKTNVAWASLSDADIDPMVALVRVNDGDVTDVVYFIAE
jgi:hypothetical protein